MKRSLRITLFVWLALVVVASCGQADHPSPSASALPRKGLVIIPCGASSSVIGMIGHLAAGATAEDIAATGLPVDAFSSQPGLVFLPDSTSAAGAAAATLEGEHLLATAAPVTAQDPDPTLLTCDYQLSDKPRAAALALASKQALVDAGIASAAQVDDPGVVITISADPLDPALAIVVVRITGPVSSDAPVAIASDVPFAVLVDLARGTVDAVGIPIPATPRGARACTP